MMPGAGGCLISSQEESLNTGFISMRSFLPCKNSSIVYGHVVTLAKVADVTKSLILLSPIKWSELVPFYFEYATMNQEIKVICD